ncbi:MULTISPECIES: hypothetical protein [Terrisporobacter]|uniref:hypothetical protein n=1 Tax=Terrisporobacter TaxID=1505652 RepID=UPI000A8C92E9|nr:MULTISPECIES: hypothetical protein [Terrisporobacter]MCC3668743.1 hypothetical protein [Terrisporobacter mayombei]MDU6983810.1 hypothetical protein [Terrisporobacter othiniensis]
MDLNLLLKICLLVVIIGVGLKLLKVFTSMIFKAALLILVCLLVLKFLKLI